MLDPSRHPLPVDALSSAFVRPARRSPWTRSTVPRRVLARSAVGTDRIETPRAEGEP
ncbi:hypothetical protein YT1_3920 [Rhodococcus ruber]|nr:hypothetical protein YT1_3920 [Rhodococcus ruber]